MRRLRIACDLTQAQAGALLGWSERGWQQIEYGERRLTAQQWALWKHVAGVEPMPFQAREGKI